MMRPACVLALCLMPLAAAAQTPKPGSAAGAVAGDPPATVVTDTALTAGECKKLGVKGNPAGCAEKVCATTDKNGVIHMACIDERAN